MTRKGMLVLVLTGALATSLASSFVRSHVRVTYPGSMDCRQGCEFVAGGIRFTMRGAGDALGTMQSETSIIEGTGSQTGNNLSRWGDYSAMTVDPVDDCTFWYTNEYIRTNGSFNWSTRIGSFKYPGCV